MNLGNLEARLTGSAEAGVELLPSLHAGVVEGGERDNVGREALLLGVAPVGDGDTKNEVGRRVHPLPIKT